MQLLPADLSDPQKLGSMSHARKPEVDISSILMQVKPWLKLLLRLFMTAESCPKSPNVKPYFFYYYYLAMMWTAILD